MTVDRILRFFKHLFEGVSVRTFVRVSGYKAPQAQGISRACRGWKWLRDPCLSVNHSYRRSIEQVFGPVGQAASQKLSEAAGRQEIDTAGRGLTEVWRIR
jgi:hypothetical protein